MRRYIYIQLAKIHAVISILMSTSSCMAMAPGPRSSVSVLDAIAPITQVRECHQSLTPTTKFALSAICVT